jgi:hypothetical protein
VSSKIAIATLYTENLAKLGEYTNQSKKQYCDKWGHEFICHIGVIDTERPAAWSKLLLVEKLLDDYDWVWWLDADAVIANQLISLDTILDETYDIIICREREQEQLGTWQLNTGSFFMQNTKAAKEFLQVIYHTAVDSDHPYWEQNAFYHAVSTSSPDKIRIKIELDQTRFNSFRYHYQKGDFVFHAVSPTRDPDVKLKFIREEIELDANIRDSKQPTIDIVFLFNRGCEQELSEISVQSLVFNTEKIDNDNIRILALLDGAPGSAHEEIARVQHIVGLVSDAVINSSADILVFASPGIHFGRRWKRRLAAAFGRENILLIFEHQGAKCDDLIALHNSASLRTAMGNLVSDSKRPGFSLKSEDSVTTLLYNFLVDMHGLAFAVMPENEFWMGTSEDREKLGMKVCDIAIYSLSKVPKQSRVNESKRLRQLDLDMIQALNKNFIKQHESAGVNT